MRRRDLIESAAGALAFAALPGPVRADPVTLGAVAAEAGIVFGCSFDRETIEVKPYGDLVRRHARTLTTDVALKFGSLRGRGPEADFRLADRMVDFAVAAGLPVRGHNLIWGDYNPDWLKKESADRRIYWFDRHIDEVVGRYAGRIAAWDVVNEPFWPDHGLPHGMRGGPWYEALGPIYVERAFRRTALADPKARLLLNEAFVEKADPLGLKVREGLLWLTRELKDRGVPLHVVGLESHLPGDGGFDPPGFRRLLADLAETGVDLALTELDVDDSPIPGDAAARDRGVAEIYRSALETALDEPKVREIVCWQLADGFSHYRDIRGKEARPLPFDRDLKPKPAFDAMVATFRKWAGRR